MKESPPAKSFDPGEKASQPMIKQWQDPKYRERMSNFLRDLNKDPEE